ncbi:hypothetical protein VYU27_009305 [Nannochloropsis oceanica]
MAAARSLTCLVLSSASCLLVLLSLLLPQSTVTFFLLPNGHSTISISSTRIRAQTRSVVATSSPSSPLFSSSSFSSSTCFPQMMRKQQQHDDLAEEQQLQQKSGVLPRLGRIVKMTIFPSIVTALGMAVQPAHAYRDMRMSPETRIVAAILGRFIIPIGLCLYFAVNRKRMAREEATRVKAALDKEQQKKEAYLAEMKEQGFNLGSVGGSLTKEEEDMISRVEEGTQLMVTEKAAWVKLLQRAQYSRDVVDGKAQPNAEIAIMTKKELKRVVNANKTVKAAGFKSE